uniref:Uncharacterized protein n=1 Tax=Oryctolagus cuniculus TaxID=9986 RepID=G1SGL1_RABIT
MPPPHTLFRSLYVSVYYPSTALGVPACRQWNLADALTIGCDCDFRDHGNVFSSANLLGEISNGIEAQFGYHIRRKELRKLHKAASEGDVARVQHLCLLKKNLDEALALSFHRTALHLACASGHSEVVMLLLERKCMINVTDNDNMTPLMKAVQSHEEKCARILLNHGADPNIIDENGNTALHYAAYCENVGIAKQLLLRSADIEVRNKDGFTPLLLAIYENGEEIAEFLIKKGANIHAVDKIKRTALMLAAQYRSTRIVRLLLEKGIDASCLNMYGWPAEKFALVTFNLKHFSVKGHLDICDTTYGPYKIIN